MVFPGHFSTGCGRCRRRKVKCDERKPTCRRCYIYGKPCPGYSDQFQFRYRRNSSQKAVEPGHGSQAGSAPSESGRSDISTSNPGDSPPAGAVQSHTGVAAPQLTVPAVLAPSLEHMSLCYFVRRFVSPNYADSYPGHLSFLPGLLNFDNYGILELATMSVAQIATYNIYGGSQLLQNAYGNYGRAITALRDMVETETLPADDRTTSAIMLLCNFMDMTGDNFGDPACHISGIYYLLEKRGPEQLFNPSGFELFFMAFIRLQTYSLMHNDNRYSDPCGLAKMLESLGTLPRALFITSRIRGLRHALLNIHESSARNTPASTASDPFAPDGLSADPALEDMDEQRLLQTVFETLDEFDEWDAGAASYWHSTFEQRTAPAPVGSVAAGGLHYDLETACTIILLRSSRLILLEAILEYHRRKCQLDPESETTKAFAEYVPVLVRNVQATIDDLIYCVPYALGDLDANGQPWRIEYDGAPALIILNSLRLVPLCPHSTPDQVAVIESILKRINTNMGVRIAAPWPGVQTDVELSAPSPASFGSAYEVVEASVEPHGHEAAGGGTEDRFPGESSALARPYSYVSPSM